VQIFASRASAPINHVWTQNPGSITRACLVLPISLYSGKGEHTTVEYSFLMTEYYRDHRSESLYAESKKHVECCTRR